MSLLLFAVLDITFLWAAHYQKHPALIFGPLAGMLLIMVGLI